MAAYGRGFRLADSNQHDLYDEANGPIDGGIYTGQAGFWGYLAQNLGSSHLLGDLVISYGKTIISSNASHDGDPIWVSREL